MLRHDTPDLTSVTPNGMALLYFITMVWWAVVHNTTFKKQK